VHLYLSVPMPMCSTFLHMHSQHRIRLQQRSAVSCSVSVMQPDGSPTCSLNRMPLNLVRKKPNSAEFWSNSWVSPHLRQRRHRAVWSTHMCCSRYGRSACFYRLRRLLCMYVSLKKRKAAAYGYAEGTHIVAPASSSCCLVWMPLCSTATHELLMMSTPALTA